MRHAPCWPAALALSLAAGCGGTDGGGETALIGGGARPDIVVVVTDDAHLAHLSYFSETKRTVNEHAMKGVAFRRAYAATPLCCPSRASLLTGLYARTSGIRLNKEVPPGARNGGASSFQALGLENATLATRLHDAGYRTAFVGKYLNHYDKTLPAGRVPPGWDVWRGRMVGHFYDYSVSVDGTVVEYGSAPEDYSTDVFRDFALDAIRTTPAGTPLFLMFSTDAPHQPATPAPRHAGLFPGLEAPDTPNHPERNRGDKPAWLRGTVYGPEDEAEIDRLHADGARCMKSVDEAVAAIVRELGVAGRLDDALLLVVNDNGMAAGSHGWKEKRAPYEEIARVFCAAASRNPAIVSRRQKTDRLVANVDIAPTLLEVAGVPLDGALDGLSFASILRQPAPAVRSDVLLEYWADELPESPLPTYCGVVTETRKYVEYANGERELYDLSLDPYELRNVMAAPEYAAEADALRLRLAELKSRGGAR